MVAGAVAFDANQIGAGVVRIDNSKVDGVADRSDLMVNFITPIL